MLKPMQIAMKQMCQAFFVLMPVLTWSVTRSVWAEQSPAPDDQTHFALTLDEVAGLVDRGDGESLALAGKLVDALRTKVTDARKPRVEAYAARLLMAEKKYAEALELLGPYIEDREQLHPLHADCYFTAALIQQTMAYRLSPAATGDETATFMGLEVSVKQPQDDDPPLIDDGLEHAIESLNLFGFIASNTRAPMRIDALDQAGQTLIIMHEWAQAKRAYEMAVDQTAKAGESVLTEDDREARLQRYQQRIDELEALAG